MRYERNLGLHLVSCGRHDDKGYHVETDPLATKA